MTTTKRALLIVVLMVFATSALAGNARHRKGIFLGLNAGWGSASFHSKLAGTTISEDAFPGAAGGLRFGYAFSNSFGLSLEGVGFGSGEGDTNWGLGSTFLMVTWWPDGSGFFLRVGAGGGEGDVLRRGTGELVHFEDAGAGRFGLGYEWQLGRTFALGVAADGIGFDLQDASDLLENAVGLGTFTIQFNWYL